MLTFERNRVFTFVGIIKFVDTCPYCNKEETKYNTNDSDEVFELYHLDHFYDKATNPLLTFSLFNLVPCCHRCNEDYKKTIKFSYTYHLNPYEQGYDDKIKFVPIQINPNYKPTEIIVKINEPFGSEIFKKINGNNIETLEKGDFGNINVFKIRSRYKNELRKSKEILEKLNSNFKNIRHNNLFFQKLNIENYDEIYVEWYKDQINDSFYPETFNENTYSKFCRDIYDYYFSINE